MTETLTLRIGTRGSPLALYQARLIARRLEEVSEGRVRGEIVTFSTKGDQLTTERLINSGGKGLFTREIDRAVDAGEVEIGVHSLKDVPSLLPEGQTLIAFPKRADPRDGLLSLSGIKTLRDLPEGAVIGTASLRREAQTLALRPDLKMVSFRGSVQTRIKKLEAGEADATFLAMAGLERLELDHLATPIAVDDMLPAAGQGIIGVAACPDRLAPAAREALASLNDAPTQQAAIAERAFLAELDGSCRTAMAAHMRLRSRHWQMRAEVLSPDGSNKWRAEATALIGVGPEELAALGRRLADSIREDAGGNLPVFEDV
ncbi:MAG: hydroxymethylbilane synthase [Henriciella sp.]